MIEVTLQGFSVEVDGLDAEWLLDLTRDAETMARMADRAKLRFANQWADIHAATAGDGGGGVGKRRCRWTVRSRSVAPGPRRWRHSRAEPFGAVLGISTLSAMNLISAAVELKHRLPRIWALMEDLAVPAWKPKMAARLTTSLSPEAAAYVDAELAPILATRGGPTIERVVAEAIARFHPEQAEQKQRRTGKAAWDVKHHSTRVWVSGQAPPGWTPPVTAWT